MARLPLARQFRRLERRLDGGNIRVPEYLLQRSALCLTGRTCDELFGNWSGGARGPTPAECERVGWPVEVAQLALEWQAELGRQAVLVDVVENPPAEPMRIEHTGRGLSGHAK